MGNYCLATKLSTYFQVNWYGKQSIREGPRFSGCGSAPQPNEIHNAIWEWRRDLLAKESVRSKGGCSTATKWWIGVILCAETKNCSPVIQSGRRWNSSLRLSPNLQSSTHKRKEKKDAQSAFRLTISLRPNEKQQPLNDLIRCADCDWCSVLRWKR